MPELLIISFFVFGGSFFVGIFFLMLIRKWSIKKRFVAIPNKRSSHKKLIPNIGGLSFFLAVPVTTGFYLFEIDWDYAVMLVSASVLVFLILGLIDDKNHTSARYKLIFQALGVVFFLLGSGWRISDFFGIFIFNELISFIYSLLFILVIINAFNMMDGIDGLAGLLAFTVLLLAGFGFYFFGIYWISVMSFSTAGFLLAFLRYNFSRNYKMLMGDTGSIWLGFLIALILVRSLNILPEMNSGSYQLTEFWDPYISISIIAIPLFDFFRVFLIRIINGTSPFSADRNHIHHLLVDYLNMPHWRASVMIVLFNLFCFFTVTLSASFLSGYHFLLLYLGLFLIYLTTLYILIQTHPKPRQIPSLKHS